eukprot:5287546-Prymnesium_polylepis.1
MANHSCFPRGQIGRLTWWSPTWASSCYRVRAASRRFPSAMGTSRTMPLAPAKTFRGRSTTRITGDSDTCPSAHTRQIRGRRP